MKVVMCPSFNSFVTSPSKTKDRKFLCCPNSMETSCNYFADLPEEPTEVDFVKPSLSKSAEKQDEHYLTNDFINDFASKLNL